MNVLPEWRCRVCGIVEQKPEGQVPLHCGVPMMPGSLVNGVEKPGQRIDVYQRSGASYGGPNQLRPGWLETWEVWLRRDEKLDRREQIGHVGRLLGGMWEFEMVLGVMPHDGLAYTRDEAIKKMVDIFGAWM